MMEGGEDNLEYFKTGLKYFKTSFKKELTKLKNQSKVLEKLKGQRKYEKCLADTKLFIEDNGIDYISQQMHYEVEFKERVCTDFQDDTDNRMKKIENILENLESNMTFE